MKLTVNKIIAINEGLNRIKTEDTLMSFRICRILQEFEPIMKAFREANSDLLRKYADLDDNGNPVIEENKFHIKDMESYFREMDKIGLTEEEVNVAKLSLSALINSKISVEVMSKIMPILNDDIEAKDVN